MILPFADPLGQVPTPSGNMENLLLKEKHFLYLYNTFRSFSLRYLVVFESAENESDILFCVVVQSRMEEDWQIGQFHIFREGRETKSKRVPLSPLLLISVHIPLHTTSKLKAKNKKISLGIMMHGAAQVKMQKNN